MKLKKQYLLAVAFAPLLSSCAAVPLALPYADRLAETFIKLDKEYDLTDDKPAQKPKKSTIIQTGDEVAKAQSLLNQLGYNAGKVDGKLGNNTKLAILQYRSDHSLGNSPNVDAKLVAHLTFIAGNDSNQSVKPADYQVGL